MEINKRSEYSVSDFIANTYFFGSGETEEEAIADFIKSLEKQKEECLYRASEIEKVLSNLK